MMYTSEKVLCQLLDKWVIENAVKSIPVSKLEAGMPIRVKSTPRASGVMGVIKKINPKTLMIETETQFRPDGPVHTHLHKYIKGEIEGNSQTILNGEVVEIVGL